MTWDDDQDSIVAAKIKDNILSHLDNVSYKIKFFMMHSDHPIYGDLTESYLQSAKKIIIAETGVTTGFYIKDMGFNNYVSYRLHLRPLGITGQLNIIEPFGMSLYEKLVIASHELGLENHLEAKYVIQITFNGHESSGEQVVVPFKWLVPVLIQKMTSTVTVQGSDYTLQFVGLNYKASTNIASTSKEPMAITARTFGEFIEEYTDALNKHELDKKNMGAQSVEDIYEFKFDPGHPDHPAWDGPTETEARGFLLGASDPENLDKSRKTTSTPWKSRELREGVSAFGERGRGRLSGYVKVIAGLGTDTYSFVEGVFMQTKEMKERVKHTGDAASKGLKKEKEIIKTGGQPLYSGWEDIKNKWYLHITSTIKNNAWDPRRNKYSRTITYVLHQYRVYHSIGDGAEYRRKMNPANIKQTTIDKMNALTNYGLLRKAYYWIYTGENSEVLGFNFNFDNLYYIATDTYPDSSLDQRTPAGGDGNTMPQGDKQSTTEHTSQGEEDLKDLSAAVRAKGTGRTSILFARGKEDEYLEDLSLNRTATDKIGNAPFSNPPYLPDIAPSDMIHGVGPGGLTAVKDPNRIVYNINSGDMMELNMQIKGDPFWLGHTTGTENTPDKAHAPYSTGANYLYIEFRVPQGVDPDSGQMEMGVANNISGIYFITNVQSSFTDGQFIQSLTGYLDITFGLSVVRNHIANKNESTTSSGGHFLNSTGGIQ